MPSKSKVYFYNCSMEYLHQIYIGLYDEIIGIIDSSPRFKTQREINTYLFKQFTDKAWSYDSKPTELKNEHFNNDRNLCLTSTNLTRKWHSDFAKAFDDKLVQVEIQFGKVEAMFKDFCGFRIAYSERRLALGIEVIMANPNIYFSHRKSSISGMAYFDIAKEILPFLGLDCPIMLIGIET